MAVLAIGDQDAVSWLVRAQRLDGAFGLRAGGVTSDETALVALALPDGDVLERALDHVETTAGANAVECPGPPPFGWPWTAGAHGWTEPTAWGVLALRRRRPRAEARIADGIAVLRERECAGGGWNYGTASGFGVELEAFVQTTALALLAVQGERDLTERGLADLRRRWRSEGEGLLSLATATVAFRLLGDPSMPEATDALATAVAEPRWTDTVTLAWAALALGEGADRLVLS